MEEYKAKFDIGTKKAMDENYRLAKIEFQCYSDKLKRRWETMSDEQRKEACKIKAKLKKKYQQYPSKDQMDPNFKRLLYTRYADDFLIGIVGSKKDAERIKEDIREYFNKKLSLELSDEKTLITSAKDKARFLGYDVTICQDNKVTRVKGRGATRIYTNKVKLYLPKEKWIGKLLDYGVLKIINNKDEKERWKPLQRDDYIFLSVAEMVHKYNAQIRGIYNYYRLASNVSVLNKFYYVMEYSLYKTIAAKYRITMTKAKLKYTKNKEFKVPYQTKRGIQYAILYNEGFKRIKYPLGSYVDTIADYSERNKPKELFFRYKANICEYCGSTERKVKVIVYKSMSEIDKTTDFGKIMLKKNRKTLVVCEDCYNSFQQISRG